MDLIKQIIPADEFYHALIKENVSLLPSLTGLDGRVYVLHGSIFSMFYIETDSRHYRFVVRKNDGIIFEHLAIILPVEQFLGILEKTL